MQFIHPGNWLSVVSNSDVCILCIDERHRHSSGFVWKYFKQSCGLLGASSTFLGCCSWAVAQLVRQFLKSCGCTYQPLMNQLVPRITSEFLNIIWRTRYTLILISECNYLNSWPRSPCLNDAEERQYGEDRIFALCHMAQRIPKVFESLSLRERLQTLTGWEIWFQYFFCGIVFGMRIFQTILSYYLYYIYTYKLYIYYIIWQTWFHNFSYWWIWASNPHMFQETWRIWNQQTKRSVGQSNIFVYFLI